MKVSSAEIQSSISLLTIHAFEDMLKYVGMDFMERNI